MFVFSFSVQLASGKRRELPRLLIANPLTKKKEDLSAIMGEEILLTLPFLCLCMSSDKWWLHYIAPLTYCFFFFSFSLSSFQPRGPPSPLCKPGLVTKDRRVWSRQSGWLRWGTTIQRGWLLHRGIWRREKSTPWRKGPFCIGNFCLSLCYGH